MCRVQVKGQQGECVFLAFRSHGASEFVIVSGHELSGVMSRRLECRVQGSGVMGPVSFVRGHVQGVRV